jgi:Tfp pilus assembly protein PilN
MKQINFLPKNIKAKVAQRRLIGVGFLMLVIGLLVVGSIWLFWQTQIGVAKQQLTTAQNSLNSSNKLKSKMQTSENMQTDLTNRITQLNSLSSQEISWSKLFLRVSSIIPQNIQISTISYNLSTGSVVLKISGSANNDVDFAVMLQSMQSNNLLSKVSVDSYALNPQSGRVTFSMSCDIVTTGITYGGA